MSAARGSIPAAGGFLLVDKPAGPSSHLAVQQGRRALGIGGRRGTRAGHAGTLDPFATGLLVVLIGRATRLMPFVVGHDKSYVVDVRFGAASDTDDATGELIVSDAPQPSRVAVVDAVQVLARRTEQVPPAVSAIHIDGVRSYQRVRRGETVTVPPRAIRIDAIDLLDWRDATAADGAWARLEVRCGTGTYMRALARDLGDLVGCPAHCEALRRTRVGAWRVEDAIAPVDASVDRIRAATELVGDLPTVRLDDAAAVAAVAAGRRVPMTGIDPPVDADQAIAVLGPDDALVAIGHPHDDAGQLLQPRTVLVDPPVVEGSTP